MPVVDDIKGRLDILDVVSEYAPLQRSGRSYKSACPFHTEKTPSFFVFPERQSWRCFGACATGGDLFSFIMRVENLDFSEALKLLARRAGVDLAEHTSRKGESDSLYRVNDLANEFFCRQLASKDRGARAREYLKARGLSQETIEKFQLGLSPRDGESLMDFLASKEVAAEQVALAGLITRGQGEVYKDLFWGRIMIPIRDAEGRLAGFGGRSLDDSGPKYMNSPKSPVFDKSSILYGLHLAKDSIKEEGIVIVEGYMDTIMAHQHHFSNVVASMGTALTNQQVSIVKGLIGRGGPSASRNVVLALDPDTAGQEATLRSLESSWKVFLSKPLGRAQGADLYQRSKLPALQVAPLPEGKDPDNIIRESPDEWAALVKGAVPLMDYLFSALSARLDPGSPQGKSRLAELLFPLVAAIEDPFQQDHYFQRLAGLLGVNEATLEASLGRPKSGSTSYSKGGRQSPRGSRIRPDEKKGPAAGSTPFTRLDHDPLEEHCLTLILLTPQLLQLTNPSEDWVQVVAPDTTNGEEIPVIPLRLEHFRRVENREVFTNWIKCSILGDLKDLLDPEIIQHLEYLLGRVLPPLDTRGSQADYIYCVRRLEERYLRELNKEEELRLSQAAEGEREQQEHKLIQLTDRLNKILRK